MSWNGEPGDEGPSGMTEASESITDYVIRIGAHILRERDAAIVSWASQCGMAPAEWLSLYAAEIHFDETDDPCRMTYRIVAKSLQGGPDGK